MLALHTSSVFNVHMSVIDDIICKIYTLHLEQYFIQQKHDLNLRHLC